MAQSINKSPSTSTNPRKERESVHDISEERGVKQNGTISTDKRIDDFNFSNTKCIMEMRKGCKTGDRDNYIERLASDQRQHGSSQTDTIEVLTALNDGRFEPKLQKPTIEKIVERVYSHDLKFDCSDPIKFALCGSDCGTPKTVQKQATPDCFGMSDSGSPFVLYRDGHALRYAFIDGRKLCFTNSQKFNDKHESYIPPPSILADLKAGFIRLPSKPTTYGSAEKLVNELMDFIDEYYNIEVQDRELIALWVLFSWVFDRYRTCPLLHFEGDYGSGKSKLKDILHELSFFGRIFTGSGSSAAYLRMHQIVRGTIIIDECDFLLNSRSDEMTRQLRIGFEANNPVARCLDEASNYRPEQLNLFSPKILTSIGPIADQALRSRCVHIDLPCRMDHDRCIELPDSIKEEGGTLRSKLTMFRLEVLYSKKSELSRIPAELDPRVRQVFTPLYDLATTKNQRKNLVEVATDQSKAMGERRQNGDLPIITKMLCGAFQKGESITIGKITEQVNKFPNRIGEQITRRKTGTHLTTLGICKTKIAEGITVRCDSENINSLNNACKKYNIQNKLGGIEVAK